MFFAQFQQTVTDRLDLVHNSAANLYGDSDSHMTDLYYSEVMKKFFDNAGYHGRKEVIAIPVNRVDIARAAEDWFKKRGILAKPLTGNRLELGVVPS